MARLAPPAHSQYPESQLSGGAQTMGVAQLLSLLGSRWAPVPSQPAVCRHETHCGPAGVGRPRRARSVGSALHSGGGGGAVLPSQVNALPAAAVEALPSAAGISAFNERTNALGFESGGGQRWALFFAAALPPTASRTFTVSTAAAFARSGGAAAAALSAAELAAAQAVRGVEARVVVAREGGVHGASDAAAAAPVVLENGNLALTFDARSGLLTTITNKAASPGLSANVSQNLHQYMPADDGTDGAYLFRPVAGGTLDVGACCTDPTAQTGSCPGLPPSTAAQGCKNVKKKDYALVGPAAGQPVLLVTTRSQGGATSYGDVTTATTRNVSATNASFNVARPAASGTAWGQDVGAAVLELDAAAAGPGPGGGAGLHAGFVAGSAGAGGSALDWATVEVVFDAAALAELGAGDDAGVRMLVTPRLGASGFGDSDGRRDAIFAASPLELSGAGASLLVR